MGSEFFDFDGGTPETLNVIQKSIEAKKPLILINMLPEQVRNFIQLDIRVKV